MGGGVADPGRAASPGTRTDTSLCFPGWNPRVPGNRGSAEGQTLRSERTGWILKSMLSPSTSTTYLNWESLEIQEHRIHVQGLEQQAAGTEKRPAVPEPAWRELLSPPHGPCGGQSLCPYQKQTHLLMPLKQASGLPPSLDHSFQMFKPAGHGERGEKKPLLLSCTVTWRGTLGIPESGHVCPSLRKTLSCHLLRSFIFHSKKQRAVATRTYTGLGGNHREGRHSAVWRWWHFRKQTQWRDQRRLQTTG